MNPSERRRALSGAFAVEDDWKPKKKVLLVDDIYTTGSTVDELARILKRKWGTKSIFSDYKCWTRFLIICYTKIVLAEGKTETEVTSNVK